MKLYIAGRITGNPNFKKEFEEAAKALESEGHIVMNPAILPLGFEHPEYMHICFAMIDVCEGVALLPNWIYSKGARQEQAYAMLNSKEILYLLQTINSSE